MRRDGEDPDRLSDLVRRCKDRALRAGRPPEFAMPKRLIEIVGIVHQKYPDEPPPKPQDAEAYCLRALDLLRRNDWPARLSAITAAIRPAFGDALRDDPRFAELREFLIREAAVSDRPGFLSPVADAYLDSWAPEAPHTRALAAALRAALPRLPDRRRRAFEGIGEVLDPDDGAMRLGARLAATEAPRAALAAEGLSREAGGFLAHMQDALVAALSPALARGEAAAFGRIAEWLRKPDGIGRDFGAARALNAILEPWAEREPPAAYRDTLLRELVDLYGDPRSKGVAWQAASERARKPIVKWLVGATLNLFLDVVTEAERDVANNHWPARNAFWRSLYAAGRIDDARVAFSGPAAAIMRRLVERDRTHARIHWVEQTAGGSRAKTSLLVIRIGSKIVVEGSHMYKVHIFSDRDPKAPRLDADSYNCEAIRANLSEDRKRTHNGDWQSWVLARI